MAAEGMRKITLEVPVELLERAQRAVYWRGPQHGYAVQPAYARSGPGTLDPRPELRLKAGVTETVRAGLRELISADAFEQLSKMRGRVKFGVTWQELKDKEPPARVRARAAAKRNKRRSWRQKERGK